MKEPVARKKSRGLAIVEMTIILPVFLLLVFGVVELYRALLANNIIVNMSREGANLIVRSSWVSPQEIMDALADSAGPIDMSKHGAIYVTIVVGEQGENPYVQEQYRWIKNGSSASSRIWSDCGQNDWVNGRCNVSGRPRLSDFLLSLKDGESTHVVEVFYDHQVVTEYAINNSLELYSYTLL